MAWTKKYESRFLSVDPELRRFRVNRSAYHDAAVFAEEKEKILYKSWLYIGHESEVKKPNDYVVRKIVDQDLIFTRSPDGVVRAFYNTCTHRGAILCREREGNRKVMSCPYHAWTFNMAGELVSQSARYGYPEGFNADGIYNLKPAPRLEHRAGFYFVNFDAHAISLDEYLGDAADRIDMMAQHTSGPLEVIGLHEYEIAANYKMMSENSYDGYHLLPTHPSYFEYQQAMSKGIEQGPPGGECISLTHGHATVQMDIQAGRPVAQWLPVWGEEVRGLIEERKQELTDRLGPDRAYVVGQTHRLMVIFPNTVMNDQQSIQIRSVLPLGPDRMVTRAWLLGPANEPAELRRVRLEGALSFLGPGGFATPDDVEMLEICQQGYGMGGVEWNDLSKGFRPEENTLRDHDNWDNELQIRSYWTQYDKMMTGGPDGGGDLK